MKTETCRMTPDEIFAALAASDELPREAMTAAGERREEMIPVFLDQIDRLRHARVETVSEADRSSFLFVYYLLGEWRDDRAYRPLTALLRQDPGFLDLLLGDALTEATARVIAGIFDGDLQPILDVIADADADEFVRCQMIDALVLIANHHPNSRPSAIDYLEAFFSSEIEKPETLWDAWAFAVAEIGFEKLEPQVRQAFEEEWISPDNADLYFFQEKMRQSVEGRRSKQPGSGRFDRMINDAIGELSHWYAFSDKHLKARAKEQASARSLSHLFGDTFTHDTPKLGRNDPCPCGSGKKFKKCCLH